MKTLYQKILFATDLGPQSYYIGERAVRLSQITSAKVQVLHVIEFPITYTANFAERENIMKKAEDVATKSLIALCTQLGIDPSLKIITQGEPQTEILEIAKEQKFDLIVVGSHGVGGYTHALGSTANTLLSTAHCDVLIIQVTHLQDEIAKIPAQSTGFLWQPLSASFFAKIRSATPEYGSKKGFGSQVKTGPRLSMRPKGVPYHGGTREDEEDNNDED
ncbi:MAG: universal stress protein [Candidatus Berkiellales bacterium]